MANLFVLPPVDASQKVRVDTAPDSDSAATVAFSDGTPVPGALLTADDDGNLPRVTATAATLYLKRLTYHGDVTGTPIAVVGSNQTPGAGGGGTTGSSAVVRKFPFAFDTPGLVTGHTVYTPTAGDVLLDAWFQIDAPWDGTTPLADFGNFRDTDPRGMFAQTFRGPVTISGSDDSFQDPSLLLGNSLSSLRDVATFDQIINVLKAPPVPSTPQPATQFVLYDGRDPYSEILPSTYGDRILPAVFVGLPIKVCVSQDGTTTGADPGSTTGSGALYLVTATPVAP